MSYRPDPTPTQLPLILHIPGVPMTPEERKESVRRYKKRYRAEHRDELREAKKKWAIDNPEKAYI